MDGLLILAIVLFIYGVFVIYVAFARPKVIWGMGKIQGFVKLLGETGTRVFFVVWALAAIVGGYFALINADI